MGLYDLARGITDGLAGDSLHWKLGTITTHPDGYEIEITSGQYWGTSGVSNFWYWKRLDSGKEEHGYGW